MQADLEGEDQVREGARIACRRSEHKAKEGGSRVRTSAMIGISLSEAVYGVANSMAGARNSVIW